MRITCVLWLVLLIVFGLDHANAVSTLPIGRFLATALTDERMIGQAEETALLRQAPVNTPFIKGIELRTRIDAFESERLRYAVRVEPAGWGETGAAKHVAETTLAYTEAERERLLNDVLLNRYSLVVDCINHQRMIALKEALTSLYKDRFNVLRLSADDPTFDPNNLIKAENDEFQAECELIDLKNEAEAIVEGIGRLVSVNGPVMFDTDGLIEIAQIETVFRAAGSLKDHEPPILAEARLNSQLMESRYRLAVSEKRNYLKFIETAYDMSDSDALDRAFSIQIGIAIPWVNSSRLEATRRKLESVKAHTAYTYLRQSVEENMVRLSTEGYRLIRHHGLLVQKTGFGDAGSVLERYRKVDGADPLILLKMKESLLVADIAVEKTVAGILGIYVRFLGASGKLSEKPYRNYLSSAMEALVP